LVPPKDIGGHQDLGIVETWIILIAEDIHLPADHIDSHDVIDQIFAITSEQGNDHGFAAPLFNNPPGAEHDSQDMDGLVQGSGVC
jgi:hypothetical protein